MKTTVSLQSTSKTGLANRISNWLESDNRLFSLMMEESVSNRQALLACNALLSFTLLIGSAFMCIEALLFVFAYFVYAINLCKKGGLK